VVELSRHRAPFQPLEVVCARWWDCFMPNYCRPLSKKPTAMPSSVWVLSSRAWGRDRWCSKVPCYRFATANAASTASSGDAAAVTCPPRSQLPRATTGRPTFRASPISERVPYSPPTAIITSPVQTRQVSRLPHACNNGVSEILVSPSAVLVRQDTDGNAARFVHPVRGGLHHSGETTADDDPISLCDETPDLSGEFV